MTWYRTLVENGALQRCKSEEEREGLLAGFADHLRDQQKDRELDFDTHRGPSEPGN